MTSPTEEVVRRLVGRLLRSDYRGEFFCSSCLVKLARESLDTTYPKSEIERAMDTVFQSPGALRSVPTSSAPIAGKRCRASGRRVRGSAPSTGGMSHDEAILAFVA